MPKKIAVKVGTLVDLKAELAHKKQQTPSTSHKHVDPRLLVKDTPSGSVFIGHKSNVLQREQIERRKAREQARDDRARRLQQLTDDQRQQQEYSAHKLAQKAKLYDKLTRDADADRFSEHESDEDESDGRYLVDFTRKRADPPRRTRSPADDDGARHIAPSMRHVYAGVDAPGPSYLRADAARPPSPQPQPPPRRDTGDTHYQHVADDDRRELGAGYFRFATDAERRKEQLDALQQTRQETTATRAVNQQQHLTDAQRLQARLARIAAKRGIAAEHIPKVREEAVKTPAPASIPLPGEDEVRAAREREEERERAELKRKWHVREWDKGKDERNPTFTQTTWVKKQRDERDPEFAPPAHY